MLNTKRVTCAAIPVIFVFVSTGFSVGLIPTKYSLSSAFWMSFYKENNSSHFICFHYFFLEKRIMIVIGMMGSSMDEFSLLLFLIRRTSFLYMTTCNWILTSAAPVVQGCLNFHQKVKMSSLLWERNKIYLSWISLSIKCHQLLLPVDLIAY